MWRVPTWHRLLVAATGPVAGFGSFGCHDTQHHWVLRDVSVSLPPVSGQERLLSQGGGASDWLEARRGGSQTILMACFVHDNPEVFDDESGMVFLIVLDGRPARRTISVTPANGRFVVGSAWIPARKPYVGLEGTIRILSVWLDGSVLADCDVRTVTTGHVDRTCDLKGLRRFAPARGDSVAGCVRVVESPSGQEGTAP